MTKQNLSRLEFATMNAEQGLELVHRSEMGGGVEVFISEGIKYPDANMDEKHWLMTWAMTRDERVKEAMTLRIPFYMRFPSSGIEITSERADRIKVALEAANKWYDTAKSVGWL